MTASEINELINRGKLKGIGPDAQLVETHISWVILGQEFAFKIKKPIWYSFLDFSTLEKRKLYCDREVELNSRLAGDVYLDVLPVRKNSNSLYIGIGEGEVIDYAVRMRRLDSRKQMDILLKENKVDKSDISNLAAHIASFHQRTAIIYEKDVLDVRWKFSDLDVEKTYLENVLGNNSYNLITEAIRKSEEFIKAHADMINSRLLAGYFRDCHGDLHTRNIFLLPEPLIFDCIEFNDDYRQIDVLNEVAFLCMDLDAFARQDLSEFFIRTYNTQFPTMRTQEDENLFLYYKAYRANVRAKVNSLRAKDAADAAQKKLCLQEVSRYLQLMNRYLMAI